MEEEVIMVLSCGDQLWLEVAVPPRTVALFFCAHGLVITDGLETEVSFVTQVTWDKRYRFSFYIHSQIATKQRPLQAGRKEVFLDALEGMDS